MYARGEGYFNDFLPKLGMRPGLGRPLAGQETSYFCLQNKFWRILGLDTGYNSVGIPVLEDLLSKLRAAERISCLARTTLSKDHHPKSNGKCLVGSKAGK
jgi:hypothetical protein